MKKDTKIIIFGALFIVVGVAAMFLIDFVQTKNLLKNGTKASAQVISRYYEINRDTKDTTLYTLKLMVLPDTNSGRSLVVGKQIQANVKQESFNKYVEGSIVKVVYDNEDLDHAKLIEEIE